jgi:Transcriptional regulator, AbiEi antitoxin
MVAGEPSALIALAKGQPGVVSRSQAMALGMSPSAVDHRVNRGSWVRPLPGVYRTFTGRPDDLSRAWAALLYAGDGAMLGPQDTFASHGLGGWPDRLTVVVPSARRVAPQPGLRVLRARHCEAWRAVASTLPRMRLEAAALLLVQESSTAAAAIDALITVTSGRRTTTERLRAELDAWPRLRRRQTVAEVLADVEDGVASPLERHWRQDVEIAHGLPRAVRNAAVIDDGRRGYRDLDYDPYRVVAELDGRIYHPDSERFRDRARDNLAARQQRFALRYGWREVMSDPCGCARELANLLAACGWTGRPRPCGPDCTITRVAA